MEGLVSTLRVVRQLVTLCAGLLGTLEWLSSEGHVVLPCSQALGQNQGCLSLRLKYKPYHSPAG